MPNIMSRTTRELMILCAAALMWLSCAAQSPPSGLEVTPSVKTEQSNRVRVSMHTPPGPLELPGVYNLTFRVSNLDTNAQLLKSFQIVPVHDIRGLIEQRKCDTPQVAIPPNQEHLIHCTVGAAWSVKALPHWGNIALQPGTYPILAVATMSRATDDMTPGELTTTSTVIQLDVRPSVWQVVLGAGLGSAMLALFVMLSPGVALRYLTRANLSDNVEAKRSFTTYIGFWLTAFVAATMFILLTYRLRDTGAPFTVTVNDFYGGVVIGMFGFFLADWITEKLFASTKKNKESDAAAPVAGAPPPVAPLQDAVGVQPPA